MPKTNQRKPVQRFTADEIVRTIDAVQAAGLTVYGVEITLAGAINISTQPPSGISKQCTTPRQMPETKSTNEAAPAKKQA